MALSDSTENYLRAIHNLIEPEQIADSFSRQTLTQLRLEK